MAGKRRQQLLDAEIIDRRPKAPGLATGQVAPPRRPGGTAHQRNFLIEGGGVAPRNSRPAALCRPST
jgi:hypothetical protein